MKYKLIRSRRRTLCLEIKNATLVVRAPYLYPEFKIKQFVLAKESWINKHIAKARRRPSKKINQIYIGGKCLRLVVSESKTENFQITNDEVAISAVSKKVASEILKNFLLDLTKQKICQLLPNYEKRFNLKTQKITYKFYKSRWGSCSPKNVLSFNAGLSMAPDDVIEYVLIHEVVHVQEKNHKKRFWEKVERYDPYYKLHRKWLSQNRDMLKI